MATAYTHFPSTDFVQDFLAWDVPQTIRKNYTYFGGLPDRRAKYMVAHGVVVDWLRGRATAIPAC